MQTEAKERKSRRSPVWTLLNGADVEATPEKVAEFDSR